MESKISPTLLKLVARNLKEDGVHGSSGVAVIASTLRAKVPASQYTGSTDKEVILSYFNSLNLDATPPKQKASYKKQLAKRRERESKPHVTPRTDFSTDWCVFTDVEHPPWALEGEEWEDPTLYHNWN